MPRKKKNYKNLMNWLVMIVTWVALIGVGGLFVNGAMLGVPILSYLPTIVHTIVGWIIIGLTVLAGILKIGESVM